MQQELHRKLAESGRRFLEPGEVIVTAPHGLPVKAVVHAVAVNGFYESSVEMVRAVVDKSLRTAASLGARSVAMTAVATGFGRMSLEKFAAAISPLRPGEYPPLDEVVICVRRDDERKRLTTALSDG
jgi:O-acetyl-ADP-ribose deacetylase (regulator of RNase III)